MLISNRLIETSNNISAIVVKIVGASLFHDVITLSQTMHKKLFNRTLIIDDDYVSGYLTKVTLEEMATTEHILTFIDPRKAIEYIKEHCTNQRAASTDCPDLILLDINMPAMNGFEFLEAIKMIGQTNLIREVIIVLSSSSAPKDISRMAEYGVRGYLSKPLTEQNLLEALD